MDELLRKLGIAQNLSQAEILELLGEKQMEYLDRLDNVDDEKRRQHLQAELQEINSAINTLSWTMKREDGISGVDGIKRDVGDEESFDELKGEKSEENKLVEIEEDSVWYSQEENLDEAYIDAVAAIETGSVSKGVSVLCKLASKDYLKANIYLASFYKEGKKVEQDIGKAIGYYYMAAEAGDVESQLMLGRMYSTGTYLDCVDELAFYWMNRAAQSDNAEALGCVGTMYYNGQGVTYDISKAVTCYEKGAMLGDSLSQFGLGCCYLEGTGVLKNEDMAKQWLAKAAEQGNLEAIELMKETWK